MDERRFFIVGFPRSGTTMLANMLNRHSKLLVTAETQYFLDIRGQFLEGELYPLSEFVEFSSQSRLLDLGLEKEDYYSIHSSEYMCTSCEFLSLTMEILANKSSINHIGEKSPIHQLYLPQISRCFPSSKIIYVMRDGRDAVLSLMRVGWTHSDLLRHSLEWVYRTKTTEKGVKQISNDVLIVKYEDVLDDAEAQLRNICDFLGEEYESQQLVADGASSPQLVPEWEMGWKKKALELPDASRKYNWKNAPMVQQLLMTCIMEDNLKKYGYEVVQYRYVLKGVALRCSLLRVVHLADMYCYYRQIKNNVVGLLRNLKLKLEL